AMTRHLSLEVQPIASSLLFGDRTRIDHELRTQFAETGAMHLLAISGLHVGILLGAFFLVCRWLNISVASTTLLLIGLAVGYAFVTNARPPILRAVLLVVMSLSAQFAHRRLDGLNALAATALILVLYRPTDLFDIGAQLSFLAVWAILVVSPWFMRLSTGAMSAELPQEESFLFALARDWGQRMLIMFVITLAILVATAPVTMSRFHLITPVGLLGNLILLPLTALTLILGFLFVACCLLLPATVPWMASPFNWSLNLLYGSVKWCGQLPGGHMYVPGVPLWWLVGFYVCLTMWWNPWRRKDVSRWGWRGLAVWCALGLSLALWPARRDNLRCTFISVGHGNAVLLELPDGSTILSDGGTFGLGRNATRQIENVLWSRGISRVDAVVISHADVDHFNGVPYLLEHISVGTVFLSPTFVDLDQRSVAEFFDATTAADVPIRFIHSGDELQRMGTGETNCHIRILHPPPDWQDEDDNANSVVLAVEYGGRRLLLTGDIEDAGQTELIESASGPFDIVLAPHHGSKASNPPAFYDWAQAELVVVSTNDAAVRNRLRDVVGDSELLTTAEAGAITVTVAPDGEMTVESFLRQ
ncbi:MAG: ComEC/Rec2 family competence protein, partial [Planctomycetaceae bacterium]|nr:ComEC/Rec2 family competence protein [Planctomycetaceae bacterium]